jgi:hypothetical protein
MLLTPCVMGAPRSSISGLGAKGFAKDTPGVDGGDTAEGTEDACLMFAWFL